MQLHAKANFSSEISFVVELTTYMSMILYKLDIMIYGGSNNQKKKKKVRCLKINEDIWISAEVLAFGLIN
jgi:hypothetical protein